MTPEKKEEGAMGITPQKKKEKEVLGEGLGRRDSALL